MVITNIPRVVNPRASTRLTTGILTRWPNRLFNIGAFTKKENSPKRKVSSKFCQMPTRPTIFIQSTQIFAKLANFIQIVTTGLQGATLTLG